MTTGKWPCWRDDEKCIDIVACARQGHCWGALPKAKVKEKKAKKNDK